MSEKITVIGSGPGGYRSAIRAAEAGFEVTLVEKWTIGGVCTNRGCIPSKAFLSVSERIDAVKEARRKGLEAELHRIDTDDVQNIVNRAVKKSRKGIENKLEEKDIDIVSGEGKVIDERTVEVGNKRYESDYIIIATGSKPVEVPGLDFDNRDIMTSRGALYIDEVPDSMVVVGGGYIGVELASVYSSLGTDINMVELLDRVLPVMDRSLSEETRRILKRKGFDIYTGSKVTDVSGEGPLKVKIEGDTEKTVEGDKVLCAVGRKPTPPETDLDITAESGEVIADDHMKTPVDNIYAVGDVNGKSQLAHSAYKQAEIAVEDIQGNSPRSFSEYHVPAGVYTHPEIATIGLTQNEAEEKYESIEIGEVPISATGRGSSTGQRTGLAKVIEAQDEIVGIHLICPGATDIIQEGHIAMENDMSAEELVDVIHPHPTYSEGIWKAVKEISG